MNRAQAMAHTHWHTVPLAHTNTHTDTNIHTDSNTYNDTNTHADTHSNKYIKLPQRLSTVILFELKTNNSSVSKLALQLTGTEACMI